MSDTLAGLTRRLHAFAHDRETAEELSHLIDEAKEHECDGFDAVLELALVSPDDEEDAGVLQIEAIIEEVGGYEDYDDDDSVGITISDDGEVSVADEDVSDADLAELAALEEGLDDEDEMDLDESTLYIPRGGEVFVL